MRCGGNLRNGSNAGLSYLNCRNRLRNANWQCFEIESSFIDMVGYRIYKDHVTLRRCNMKKSRRAVIRYSHKPKNIHLARRVLSYSGMIKYSDSVLFCIKYNIHKYVKKARKVVSNYDKAKIRLQVA